MSGPKDQKLEWTSPEFSLNLFSTIKSAQSQNGIRLNDYERYRHYCNRRLRRLRKSLKFTHGRKKFVKKSIDPKSISDSRFLDLVLFQAERSWAYAKDLKIDRENPRAKFHAVRRLTKGYQYAEQLLQLALVCGNGKTQVEAEVYRDWMRATLHLERSEWNEALPLFFKSRAVFSELKSHVSQEEQAILQERLDDVNIAIRFCSHNLSKSEDVQEADVDVSVIKQKLSYLSNVTENKEETKTDEVVVDENVELRIKNVLKRANIEVSLKETHLEKRKLDDVSILEVPQAMPIPCKPVLFDMAFTFYNSPDLTEKKKQPKSSLFSFW